MAALADFARYVRPNVPMCPEIQVLDAVLHAGIEFCKRTRIYRQTFNVTTVIGQSNYDLTSLMATNTYPNEILSVARESSNLTPTSRIDELESLLELTSGSPNKFYLTMNNLALVPTPEAIETLSLVISAYPTESSTTIPDQLFERYRLEIAAGACAILMKMSGKPWSNLDMAIFNNALFKEAIDGENVRFAKGGCTKTLRSVINSF